MTIFIQDYMGKIFFVTGAILLVAGVLTLNIYGTIFSAGALLFGIVFTFFGIFIQIGFFSAKLVSLSGVGTILMSGAIVIFAFSAFFAEFVKLHYQGIVPIIWRGTIMGYTILYTSERPFLWLSSILVEFGVAILIAGVAFKLVNALKP